MPKYNLAAPICDEDGKQIVEGQRKVTARVLFMRALLSDYNPSGPAANTPDEKSKRYELWLKVRDSSDDLECSLEEAQTIKSCVGVFPTLIYGQLAQLLDGKGKPALTVAK